MRLGHVATVASIVSDRESLLNHANWSRRGGIEYTARVVDVSAAGDWSQVKVWYGPQGGLGTSTYPTNGFIYGNGAPKSDEQFDEPKLPQLQMASANTGGAPHDRRPRLNRLPLKRFS